MTKKKKNVNMYNGLDARKIHWEQLGGVEIYADEPNENDGIYLYTGFPMQMMRGDLEALAAGFIERDFKNEPLVHVRFFSPSTGETLLEVDVERTVNV